MAVETFHSLIARNKRNSIVLIAVFMVFFVALGIVIGMVWGGGDWRFSILVALLAGAFAFVLTLISFYGGSSALMGMSRARQITQGADPQLFNVIEELCLAGGLPMPKVYVIDSPAMNAFATGRDPAHASVAITAGLREKLTRDELQGVMAHELSHVRHYDIRFAMLMAVLVGTVVMLSHIFLRSLWFGGGSRRRRGSREGGGAVQLVLLLVAIVLAILSPILAKIIQLAISRQREYLADAGSVELTRNPLGLANALVRLSGDTEPLEVANKANAPLFIVYPFKQLDTNDSSVFSTHPPIADRIARLRALAH